MLGQTAFDYSHRMKNSSVALSDAEHERLKKVAAQEGLSVSAYLKRLVRAADPDWQESTVICIDERQGDLWAQVDSKASRDSTLQ